MTVRTALVTGGTGGIGTAICKRLADAGHKVATNYRDESRARAWQEKMRAEGYEFSIFPGDVSDTASSQALVAAIEAELGPIDIMVSSAGITSDTTFHRMTPGQVQKVDNTNLTA